MAIKTLDDVYYALKELHDAVEKYNFSTSGRLNAIIEFIDNLDDLVGAVDEGRDIIANLKEDIDDLKTHRKELEG